MPQIIDKTSITQLIRAMAPEWAWLLKHIESEEGYVRFPPLFSQWIKKLNIANYPLLYQDERSIGVIVLMAFVTPEDLKKLENIFLECPQDTRGQLLLEFISELDKGFEAIEFPKTPAAQKRAEEQFMALPPEDQKSATEFSQRFVAGMLAGFYQSLSVMVHGEKLTSLVAQAIAGDDKAFAKAVQIDKSILQEIPYFKEHYAAAALEGRRNFLELVATHMHRPPYRGKIRHKALYLAFSLLDQLDLLDEMKHSELLDLCNEAGLDAHANRIDDVKNLSKRLAEYRKFQRGDSGLSTP